MSFWVKELCLGALACGNCSSISLRCLNVVCTVHYGVFSSALEIQGEGYVTWKQCKAFNDVLFNVLC